MAFGTIFAPKSLQHGLQITQKTYSYFGSHLYGFLVDFGLHFGTLFPVTLLEKGRRSQTPLLFLSS